MTCWARVWSSQSPGSADCSRRSAASVRIASGSTTASMVSSLDDSSGISSAGSVAAMRESLRELGPVSVSSTRRRPAEARYPHDLWHTKSAGLAQAGAPDRDAVRPRPPGGRGRVALTAALAVAGCASAPDRHERDQRKRRQRGQRGRAHPGHGAARHSTPTSPPATRRPRATTASWRYRVVTGAQQSLVAATLNSHGYVVQARRATAARAPPAAAASSVSGRPWPVHLRHPDVLPARAGRLPALLPRRRHPDAAVQGPQRGDRRDRLGRRSRGAGRRPGADGLRAVSRRRALAAGQRRPVPRGQRHFRAWPRTRTATSRRCR